MLSQNSSSVALPGKSPAMPTMAIAASFGTDDSAGITHLETTENWEESRFRLKRLVERRVDHALEAVQPGDQPAALVDQDLDVRHRACRARLVDLDDARAHLAPGNSRWNSRKLPMPVGSELAPELRPRPQPDELKRGIDGQWIDQPLAAQRAGRSTRKSPAQVETQPAIPRSPQPSTDSMPCISGP